MIRLKRHTIQVTENPENKDQGKLRRNYKETSKAFK